MQGNALKRNPELDLIEDIAGFTHDPLGYVMYAFPWGSGELKDKYPDQWQLDVLKDVGAGLATIDQVIQMATASGHDIGKSAVVALCVRPVSHPISSNFF